ncbi:MAG: exodeoxyribonuclease VII large subunit [Lachnospiraceae bacterium]|nr:exodeoxyribonuclease VII large subunit [Lachnospiraceae bacterium]
MENAVSVSQINRYIKNLFVRDYALNRIFVKGEVSNCKYHSSGHIYFTLKDSASALACVMFASQRGGLEFRLEEGQSIIVQGSISVYERDGKYQLYAQRITREGVGRLYEEYEKLKKRLLSEGLFDEHRKRKIPRYASKIGVVTAKTGAVIQDICNVSARRNPYVQIYLYPAKVQGEGAAQTVIEGLRYFEKTDVDTIIIGRGGGSIEDLWAFNEECLARAIAQCKKPVISAVGHETDVTISDYAADLRAPTPSAAAELAVYSWKEVESGLRESAWELDRQIRNQIRLCRMDVQKYMTILQHASPEDVIRQKRLYLAECQERLGMLMERRVTSARHQMELYIQELKGLSPFFKLQGGYAYTADGEGNHIQSVKQLQEGQELSLTFQDGSASVMVKKVKSHPELSTSKD